MTAPADDQGHGLSLLQLVSRYRLLIGTGAILGLAVGIGAYLLLPKSYRAEVVVATTEGEALSGGISQLAQLSGLAGMMLPSTSSSYRQEALATLKSREIARAFVDSNEIARLLDRQYPDAATINGMAVSERDQLTNRVVDRFLDDVLDVREDRRSGMITVAVKWRKPDVAAAWANGIVKLADERLRLRRRHNADDSLVLIQDAIDKTTVTELRQTLYRMYQMALEKKLQTQVSESIFFRIIDPATPPDIRRPYWPDKRLLIIASTLIGLSSGLGISMLLASRRTRG